MILLNDLVSGQGYCNYNYSLLRAMMMIISIPAFIVGVYLFDVTSPADPAILLPSRKHFGRALFCSKIARSILDILSFYNVGFFTKLFDSLLN